MNDKIDKNMIFEALKELDEQDRCIREGIKIDEKRRVKLIHDIIVGK